MISENIHSSNENDSPMECFTIRLANPMLYDRLHILSAEYSVSVEFLANIAIRRLLDDVNFVRNLRAGKTRNE